STTAAGTIDVSPSERLAPGTRVGPYTVRERIGRGGWGSVYVATHDDGRIAAIKILHPFLAEQPLACERFFREVRTLERIQHASMVQIYDVGVHSDGRPFFAMELLEGSNLRKTLVAEGRMSLVESFGIVEQLC